MNRSIISTVYVAGKSSAYFPAASYNITEVANVGGVQYLSLKAEGLDQAA